MPELPEVEAARKLCDRALKNKELTTVNMRKDPIVFGKLTARKLSTALTGQKIVQTGRKGKYFWLTFSPELSLIIHLGMTGHVRQGSQQSFRQLKSLKLELVTSPENAVSITDGRRFSRMRLVKDPLEDPTIQRLGWDVLNDLISLPVLVEKLSKRKAPIKSVLLDQSVFAGVGNWIADEILYQAKIAPARNASSLGEGEVKALAKALRIIISTAVKANADYRKFPKLWLFNFRWGKKKNAMSGRNEIIKHSTIGGRTTAWVPAVQK